MSPAISLQVIVFGMREVALRRVVDDVLERSVERLAAELHLESLIGIRRQAVEERRLDRRRLLADDAGERGALGAVALAGRAQAAEQVHLERGRLRRAGRPAAWCSAGRSRR